MKKTITLLLMLILFGAGAYLVYDLSSDKGGTKYVTFAYNDGVNNDYKCKIKDYKINCIVTEPVNGKDEFVGWYDEENNAVDIEGDFNESVTLYPKFLTAQVVTEERKAERKHLITFNMNGGTGSIEKIEVKYEEQLYRLNSLPTKDGYIFLGFYDNKDYKKGKQYYDENGESVRCFDKAGNTTLYAGWKKESNANSNDVKPVVESKKYTITFNANGGSGGQSSSKEVTYGESLPEINMTIPTRSGYKFMGWYDNSDYTKGTQYYSERCISVIRYDKQKNTTLYAGWKKESGTSSDNTKTEEDSKKYVITFNANGGSGNMTAQTVTSNVQTPLKSNTFTRTGYRFNGWNTKSDGSGKSYSNGENITLTSNITLYAKWKQDAVTPTTCTITFNSNDEKGKTSVQNINCNASTTIKTNTFTRTGYKFIGWNTKLDGSGKSYSDGESITLTSNITLYAVWNASTYIVSFNLNGANGTTPENKTVTYGKTMPKIMTAAPSRSGYKFVGWYDNNNYLNGNALKYYDSTGNSARQYDKTSNVTLYAGWDKIEKQTNKYTISFNANGGSGGQSGSTKDVTYGGSLPSISKTAPTKTGYIFIGWYDSNNYTNGIKYYDANGNAVRKTYDVVKSNVTLYAGWIDSKNTFIVKYNCGENASGNAPEEQYVVNGNLFIPKINYNHNCVRKDYVFDGWYDKSGVDWTLRTLSKMNLQNGKNGVSNNTLVLTARWYEELADKSDAKDAIKPTTMITPKNNTESITYVGKCSDLKADDRHIGLKSNQYCSYESETLKYYIAYNHSSRTGQYNITYVWVKDPYNQLKVAIAEPDPYPTQEKKDNNKWNTLILKEQMGREIIDHEIKTNDYSNRGLIGVNASAMISIDWAKFAPVGWRGQPQLNIFRNKSKTIRVSGNSFLANFQIGLAKDGHLKSYDPYVSTSEYNTGERNSLIRKYIEKVDEIQDIFGFHPILVKKGVDQGTLGDDKLDNRGNFSWNSAATRQAICQVDKNNFIIITSTKYNDTSTEYIKKDDKGPGLTLKDLSYMMTKMHCYMGYNLDGGGSTSYFYKSNKNDLKGPLVAHGSYHGDKRISADILYFVEK